MSNENDSENITCFYLEASELVRSDLTRNETIKGLFIMAYAILFVSGLTGNGAMLYTIFCRRSAYRHAQKHMSAQTVQQVAMRSPTDVFLVSLALAHILLCCLVLPLSPQAFFDINWRWGTPLCKLMPWFEYSAVAITHTSLALVIIDKYRGIVSHSSLDIRSKHASMLCLAQWIIIGLLNAPLLFIFDVVGNFINCEHLCIDWHWPNWQPYFSSKHVWSCAWTLLFFVLPLLVQVYCVACIMYKVETDLIVTGIAHEGAETRNRKQKKRVMLTLLAMLCSFFITWIPYNGHRLAMAFDLITLEIGQYIFSIACTHLMAMSCVFWTPLLYFWTGQRHRKTLYEEIIFYLPTSSRPIQQEVASFHSSPFFPERASSSNAYIRHCGSFQVSVRKATPAGTSSNSEFTSHCNFEEYLSNVDNYENVDNNSHHLKVPVLSRELPGERLFDARTILYL